MREIWTMQPRLNNTRGARADRLLGNPRFRAAYDFLCLRSETGEDLQELCSQWESIQESPEAQALIIEARNRPRQKHPRRGDQRSARSHAAKRKRNRAPSKK